MSTYETRKIQIRGKPAWVIGSEDGYDADATAYLKHCLARRESPNTVEHAARSLTYYLNFLAETGTTTAEVVLMSYSDQFAHFAAFQDYLLAGEHSERSRGVLPQSVNKYTSDVRRFYLFLSKECGYPVLSVLEKRTLGYRTAAGTARERTVYHYPGALSPEPKQAHTAEDEEIRTVLSACTGIRDRLLIRLLADTGLRIGEALGIRYAEDLDLEAKQVTVVFREDNPGGARAKYAENRSLYYSSATAADLSEYLSAYADRLIKTELLFVTREGKPLTEGAAYRMFRRLGKKTGVYLTPHMLRHYFATKRYEEGWRLEEISLAFGHRTLATTRKYIALDERDVWKKEQAFHQSRDLGIHLEGLA